MVICICAVGTSMSCILTLALNCLWNGSWRKGDNYEVVEDDIGDAD